jgi:hypothetical protein
MGQKNSLQALLKIIRKAIEEKLKSKMGRFEKIFRKGWRYN